MTGMFAVSKAGHDRDRMYIIMKEDDCFYYLVDGKTRTIQNPKKKKKKHVQLIKTRTSEVLAEKIKNNQTIYNEEIKFAIKVRAK